MTDNCVLQPQILGFVTSMGFLHPEIHFLGYPNPPRKSNVSSIGFFYQMPQENLKEFLGRPDSCVPTYLQGDYVAQFFIMKSIYITYYY